MQLNIKLASSMWVYKREDNGFKLAPQGLFLCSESDGQDGSLNKRIYQSLKRKISKTDPLVKKWGNF